MRLTLVFNFNTCARIEYYHHVIIENLRLFT
jgi:hypothetical protein